jgi:predicted permease
MTNIVLLLICLVIGVLLQKIKSLPKETHVSLNVVILYVSLPALALLAVPALEWSLDLFSLCLIPWLIFLMSWGLFAFLGKKFNWSTSVVGCLILTAGLGNTSFVGLPLIEALLGKPAVKLALFLDQSGSFLIVSSLGLYVAALYSSGRMKMHHLLMKVVSFPPFIAFVLAMVLGLFGWRAEGMSQVVLERLAGTLTPLALISVGLQLKWKEGREDLPYLYWGLGYKLIAAPVVIFGLCWVLELPKEIFEVGVLEAAMAPMITAGIVASAHGLEPRLAGMMIGVGVPLSLLTVVGWFFLIH